MHIPSPPRRPEQENDPSEERYRCGTLQYTKASLFGLFAWLLWGDFCYTVVGNIWPNVVPLLLKSQGATNSLVSLVMVTIPSIMNFFMNPVISTASDRYRSRWGRRLPFIWVATPLITLTLVLMGFSSQLGRWISGLLAGPFPTLSASGVTIGLICLLVVLFRFFELFVGTVFYYLFNDVVPPAYIGRFLGFFRVVGSLAGAAFNFFLFQYSESHTSILFLSVALLYGISFTLMAAKVKEGSYPPVEVAEHRSLLVWVKKFWSECMGHKIFRSIYVYSALMGLNNAIQTFTLFMALSIGLNLEEFGKVNGVAAIVGMLMMYPIGSLVDRFHPLRIMLIAKISFCLVTSIKFVFLFFDFSKPTTFWIYAAAAALAIPINVANTAATLPMLMRLFPSAKFGQFCAANAMSGAVGTIIGGLVSGVTLDIIKNYVYAGDYCYRFVPVWNVGFTLLAFGAMILVFREWKRLGGDKHYQPPIINPE